MNRWLCALALVAGLTAEAQPLAGGALGRSSASYATLPAPSGCASGMVPYFDASFRLVCSPTVYAPSTDTTTATGTVSARNLTATALATPTITSPLTVNGTPGATTYGYKLTARAADSTTTAASAEVTIATGNATLDGTNNITVAWPAVTGAATYKLYRTTGGAAPPKLIYTGALLTFNDIGAAGTAETPATANGTGVVTGDTVRAGAGSAATPSLAWDGGTGTGWYFPAIAQVMFSANAAARVGWRGNYWQVDSGTGARGFGISSASVASNTADTILTSPAAATWQLGATASATPVAQTLQAQGGAGTNIAGQQWNLRGSLATGTADSGPIATKTGYTAGATTTVHAESTRTYLATKWTALTAATPTGFATLTYGASSSIGAELLVTIRAGDGTNRQGMTYRLAVNSVRDAAGNTQSVVAVIGTPPVAAGSGTLTATFDVAEGAGAVTIRATAASSLSETFLDATFQASANGPGLTIASL